MTTKAKPKSPHSITEEDFDAWKTNTITQTMIAHLGRMRARVHQFWVAQLAQTEERELMPADPIFLAYLKIELRSKLEFIEDIEALSLEDIQDDAAESRQLGAIARQAVAQGKGEAH